jgi:hypothetical protein
MLNWWISSTWMTAGRRSGAGQAFRDVPEMDYSRVIASADLLKLIVENCLKKQLNFVVIKDNPSRTTRARQPGGQPARQQNEEGAALYRRASLR